MSTFRRPPPPVSTTGGTRTSNSRRVLNNSTTTTNAPLPPPPPSRPTSSLSNTTNSRNNYNNRGDGSNIQVVVRCRGVNSNEIKNESKVVVTVPSTRGTRILLTDPSPSLPSTTSSSISSSSTSSSSSTTTSSSDVLPPNTRSWDFGTNTEGGQGNVFGPLSTQATLYEQVAKPSLEQVLEGYNCTIFAYGQTGTGKTFTMEGDLTPNGATFHENAGIIPRTLYYLFDHLQRRASSSYQEWAVKVSYVELYNEELRDLNSSSSAEGTTTTNSPPLRIYDDTKPSTTTSGSSNRDSTNQNTITPGGGGGGTTGSVRIEGLEETFINDAEEGLEVLRRGSLKRISASTNMNERSSRSHSIFTITVTLKDSTNNTSTSTTGGTGGGGLMRVGKLNLVDLAGSENVARSGATQNRAREAGRINVSLLALGRVINMLSSNNNNNNNNNSSSSSDNQHIPYRESKLTRLLQDSLGGNTKTTIIATISPTSFEETSSTLSYALQATSIQNKPELNRKVSKDFVLNQILNELSRCKLDLKAARQQGSSSSTEEEGGEGGGFYLSKESFRELEEERKSYKISLGIHQQSLAELQVQKTELQSTKDQLDQNVRALTKTKETLSKTTKELEKVKSEKESLEFELESLKVENESLKCLSQAWEESRRGWKEDAQEALGDVKGLREKLARKTLVEESNHQLLNELCSTIDSETHSISNETFKLSESQTLFFGTIDSSLKDFIDRQGSKYEENRTVIEQLLVNVEKAFEKIVVQGNGERQTSQMYRRVIEETCRKLVDKITELEKGTKREQEELRIKLRRQIENHHKETSHLVEELLKPVQSLESSFLLRLSQDETLISSISQRQLDSLSRENQQLKDLISNLESNLSLEISKQSSEESRILDLVKRELDSSNQRRKEVLRDTFEMVRVGVEENGKERQIEVREREIACRELRESNFVYRTGIEETMKTCEKLKDTGVEDFTTSIEKIRQLELLESLESTRAQQARTRMLQNAASFIHESSLKQQVSETESTKKSQTNLRSLLDQTGQIFSIWTRSNSSVHSDVVSSMTDTLETISKLSTSTSSQLSLISSLNSSLSSTIESSITSKIRKDSPTGSTPKPKLKSPSDRLMTSLGIDLDAKDRIGVMETLLKMRDQSLAEKLSRDQEREAEEIRRRELMEREQGGGGEGEGFIFEEEEEVGEKKGMSRSPSIEVVSLPPVQTTTTTSRPRASSSVVVVQHGKTLDLSNRRSRIGTVLGERDSNVKLPQQQQVLRKKPLLKAAGGGGRRVAAATAVGGEKKKLG
ncbi:hypothetical protein JCM5350_001342 [Sporobolomyces pararoseus]